MNLSETARLMALVQAFNNRTVGEADVVAWQSVLDDVELPDAEEAVRRHYRSSSDWIMPAHIRRIVEQIELERARAARKWAPGQAGVPADSPMPELLPGEAVQIASEEVRRLLEELREKLSAGDRAKLFPRQTYWAREQAAYLRSHSGEPNPLYRPQQPTCGIPSPHPAHPWSIEPNEGEAEADQFQCPGVDG